MFAQLWRRFYSDGQVRVVVEGERSHWMEVREWSGHPGRPSRGFLRNNVPAWSNTAGLNVYRIIS
jgi:hypothetical protein